MTEPEEPDRQPGGRLLVWLLVLDFGANRSGIKWVLASFTLIVLAVVIAVVIIQTT